MNKPVFERRGLRLWLEERLPIDFISGYLKKKEVPRHKHSIWYYFGGLTLFFFVVQLVTGLLLMLYYRPTPDEAYASILFIVNEVSFGWLIRSMHSWAANLMIAMLFIHMTSVFFMKAYRPPREFLWFTGIGLLGIVLGFGFTGYLLPWDEVAYYATQIGTEIPKSIPLIGPFAVSLLRGGEDIGAATLTRMFSIHVAILPLLTLILIGIHLFLNQTYGVSKPIRTVETKKAIPFLPNFLLRDVRMWLIAFLVLLGISILSPWKLGPEANLLAPAPEGIKPEWYFLPLYQTLKFVPPVIWRLDGEALVNIFFLLGGAVLFFIPLLDRKARAGKSGKLMQSAGIIVLIYLVTTTLIAYFT